MHVRNLFFDAETYFIKKILEIIRQKKSCRKNQPFKFRVSCTKINSVRHFAQLDRRHRLELLVDCLVDSVDQDMTSVYTTAKNDNSSVPL